jgi:hypothetical protein
MQPQYHSSQPPTKAADNVPSNPLQSAPTQHLTPDPTVEFISAWHPADDVTELEETLDQAIAQVRALLKLLVTRTHPDVKKARQFLAQFE